MKLEKITRARWYDDACGTALAMELVGERWSLLVVRELMFGPRRFGELRGGLPGISANVLTQRLAGLERAGVVVRRRLASPASVQVYELTAWGYEAEPAIQALGRWAARSSDHDPTLPLSAASIMMSFRTMFSPVRAGDWAATIGFRIGEDGFVARVGDGALVIARGDPMVADAMLTIDPTTLAAIVYGGWPLHEAEEAGVLALVGDPMVAARFATLFPLPAKVVVE
jgi:DNA-binding HxlR family transcriptional regulator